MKPLTLLGFKFNEEEAAKVSEAKKIQKWVSDSHCSHRVGTSVVKKGFLVFLVPSLEY